MDLTAHTTPPAARSKCEAYCFSSTQAENLCSQALNFAKRALETKNPETEALNGRKVRQVNIKLLREHLAKMANADDIARANRSIAHLEALNTGQDSAWDRQGG